MLSALTAVLIIASVALSDHDGTDITEKLFVGGAFGSSCVLGISLALRPNWIRRLLTQWGHNQGQDLEAGLRRRIGHHPDCDGFQSHTVQIGGRSLCAGCTGLAIGAGTSIVAMSLYVVLPVSIPSTVWDLLIVLGVGLVVTNYIEISLLPGKALHHLVLNALMVLGFLLVVIGLLSLTGNPLIGLLGVVVSFLWLDTRIQISKWRHTETCRACARECKAYRP